MNTSFRTESENVTQFIEDHYRRVITHFYQQGGWIIFSTINTTFSTLIHKITLLFHGMEQNSVATVLKQKIPGVF